MGLKAKLLVVAFMTSCMIQFTICNPIEAKEKDKVSGDPCKFADLENIPECNKNHTECDDESKNKLEKLHKLCEKYPSCKNCETLILDSEEESVAPEIVEPIEIDLDSESPSRRLVERNIIIENDNETQYYRGYVESAANITTVIRLTNLINNTNIINMPTTLNNTNINNIHVYQNKSSETGGKYGLGYSEKGSCCYAVQPRGCMQSTSGLKCRHKRQKVCGRQCTHKVIHPNRNPCTSTQQWPYVSCPPNNGYNNNYNPGYYPSNYAPNYPQYYPPNNPQYYPPNNPGYYPQNPVFDQPDDDDDDDFPMFPDEEELNNPESGWIVSPEKCKVVSEDGLQITNCTQKGHDFDNPFARNSVSEPSKRHVRQTKHDRHRQIPYPNQIMQQPMQYYPMMYQPVYVQPMPIFMPQYYQQPPLNYPVNNYQPQQIPFPPMDQYDSYEEDQESNEIHVQPKKHFRKNKHVVMEIDEEL